MDDFEVDQTQIISDVFRDNEKLTIIVYSESLPEKVVKTQPIHSESHEVIHNKNERDESIEYQPTNLESMNLSIEMYKNRANNSIKEKSEKDSKEVLEKNDEIPSLMIKSDNVSQNNDKKNQNQQPKNSKQQPPQNISSPNLNKNNKKKRKNKNKNKQSEIPQNLPKITVQKPQNKRDKKETRKASDAQNEWQKACNNLFTANSQTPEENKAKVEESKVQSEKKQLDSKFKRLLNFLQTLC